MSFIVSLEPRLTRFHRRASSDISQNSPHERSERVVRRVVAAAGEEVARTIMAITMMKMTMMGMITTQERGRVEVAAEVEEGVQLHRKRERLRLLEGNRVRSEVEERRGITLTMVMMILVRFGSAQPKRLLVILVNQFSASSQAVETLRWRCRRKWTLSRLPMWYSGYTVDNKTGRPEQRQTFLDLQQGQGRWVWILCQSFGDRMHRADQDTDDSESRLGRTIPRERWRGGPLLYRRR